MAENIAGFGLQFGHLKIVYQSSGEDWLRDIFLAKNSDYDQQVTRTTEKAWWGDTKDDWFLKNGEWITNF